MCTSGVCLSLCALFLVFVSVVLFFGISVSVCMLQVRATFDDMKLKEDLLKGIYAYGFLSSHLALIFTHTQHFHDTCIFVMIMCACVCRCECARVYVCVSANVRACVRTCVHACVRACVCACMRACVRACVCVFVCAHGCLCVCMRERVCVCVCLFVCVRARFLL